MNAPLPSRYTILGDRIAPLAVEMANGRSRQAWVSKHRRGLLRGAGAPAAATTAPLARR